MHEAKISKICNFWTFWPVIQVNFTALFTSMNQSILRVFIFVIYLAHTYQVSLIKTLTLGHR